MMMKKLDESIQLFQIRKWFIFILSVRLVPFVQSTNLPFHSINHSDLSALESIQDDTYVQNREFLLDHLNHLNNLNYEGRNPPFNFNQATGDESNNTFGLQANNVLTRRSALSSLANIFGGSSTQEEKKSDEIQSTTNQTDSKLSDLKKENTTSSDEANKNSSTASLVNQSNFLKNHLQTDKEIDTLNRLISFSKNYENWSDHLKNPYNLNNPSQDLINLLHFNHQHGANLSDHNATSDQLDQSNQKSKNLFVFLSPEYAPGKSALFDNNHFGFKSTSQLANENDYYPRYNPAETMTDATDQNSEYDEDVHVNKLIENRNESTKQGKRNLMKNRNRVNGRARQRHNKMRKSQFDNQQYNRNIMQSGFRPVDGRLLKEQSQISPSTGVKRNLMNKVYRTRNHSNDLSLVETQQHQNDNSASSSSNSGSLSGNTGNNLSGTLLNKSKRINNSTTTPATITSTNEHSSFDPEFNQLSVGNQPFSFKQRNYRLPSSAYGKRLINDILNNQPNVRKNLVLSSSEGNKVNNESVDHSDDENNEKEETLNEQDKQLVTDRSKESIFEKVQDEDLTEMSVNEFDNKEIDKNSDPSGNQHQTNNQQIEQLNQSDMELNENEAIENENEQINNLLNSTSINQSKESDNLDITTSGKVVKLIDDELNKSIKQDKIKYKPNKNTNWKQIIDQNYKHHKIFDKYTKFNPATGGQLNNKNQFDFDSNFPSMNSYLSNENYKINLNAASGGKSSELEDDLSTSPYPNVQYNSKPNLFNSLYYPPMMKKKPFYPYHGFSTNPLNGMLFDKINLPIDNYSIDKMPPPLPPLKAPLDKVQLDNKFYNLDNKLHHLNSKYSLNSLNPPAYPLHLESTKYYEPKAHYDSKYHNSMNHWQSGLAGFLLGVVPFSFLLASMAPTISAISSGTAAAALGRRRRSIDDQSQGNLTANVICLTKLSQIISSLNKLAQSDKEQEAKIYFNQLVDLQNQCEFNFSLPIDFYEEMNKILNLDEFKARNEKTLRRLKNSYYSYSLGNGKLNLLDTILNFIFNFDLIKDRNQASNQFRTINNQTATYSTKNDENRSTYQPINFFRQREGKCVQEMLCKVLLSSALEKSFFSNFMSLVANITPSSLANKYGLDVLVFGLKGHNCAMRSVTYC